MNSLSLSLNKLVRDFYNRLHRRGIYPPWNRRHELPIRLSLVVPCYNVEEYIDDFFASVFGQSVDLNSLEIIAVDDGSTDGTAMKIERWRRRLPHIIKSVRQTNGGLAAARNTGLKYATGDWISFPDPDDFLDRDYIRRAAVSLIREREIPLSLVACNLLMFYERTGRVKDTHPLRRKFSAPITTLSASDMKDYIHLSVATAWFRRDSIDRHGLQFNGRTRPTFEDGDFVCRFLVCNANTTVEFLRDAVYYYRKRKLKNSLIDISPDLKEFYLDEVEFGYIELLRWTHDYLGFVPKHAQLSVLYAFARKFRRLLDSSDHRVLSCSEQDKFIQLARETFRYIECSTINSFELSYFDELHKVGILNTFKRTGRTFTTLFIKDDRLDSGTIKLVYFSPVAEANVSVRINGCRRDVQLVESREHRLLGETYAFEHTILVQFGRDEKLSAEYCGVPCRINYGPEELGEEVAFNVAIKAIVRPAR